MTRATLLGVDLGTSSVKAVVTDVDGTVLSQVTRAYDVTSQRPGWAESDPLAWWHETAAAVRQSVAHARATGADPPSALGLSGQMHGVVLAGDGLVPVRPAILWADTRAVDVLSAYGRLDEQATIRLANPIIPGLAGPILLWLSRFEADAVQAARWALQPKDWLRARMTGEVRSEPSDASATLLFDVAGERWDTGVMTTLGLDPAIFPPLLPWSGEPAGRLTRAAAKELGLPQGLPVAAGAADTAAAIFGSGLDEPGRLQLTLGTGGQLVTAVDRPVPVGSGTTLFRTAARHGWYLMAATTNAGIALDWVRRVLDVSWDDLYAAAALPSGDGDPMFLPHLTGERTPWLDPAMRGAWVGLALSHDRGQLLHAALEGVAFAVRTAMGALSGPSPTGGAVRVAGGGSTHPAWRQMLADVLGVPLDAVDVPAASARGAALLGGCATGVVDEQSVFGRLAPAVRRVCEPRADRVGPASVRHERWLEYATAARQVGGRGPEPAGA